MAKQTERQRQARNISKAKQKQKRKQQFRRTVLFPVGLIVAVGLGMSGWKLHKESWFEKTWQHGMDSANETMASMGFATQRVSIMGRIKTSEYKIQDALGADLGQSVWAFSLDDIRDNLQGLSSIRTAHVQRLLPDTIHIELEERAPAAVWQYEGQLSVIDVDGEILTDESPAEYRNLLVVVGEDAPEHLEGLFQLLSKERNLAERVVAAVRVGARRWNLQMERGVMVQLPEEDPERAWGYLAQMENSQKILQKSISKIDMRMGDRVFIKMDEEDETTLPQGGQQAET